MTLSSGARKFSLTAHVVFSVGWLGTVAGFLVFAVIGLTSPDEQLIRACELAAESITWWTIVPLAFASLLTGLAQPEWSVSCPDRTRGVQVLYAKIAQ